ncbi:MAG: AAA family ATPase [Sphingobacteriia bacterium]|nr:AAA family ATPase [Sphingobacteriia bacterium]
MKIFHKKQIVAEVETTKNVKELFNLETNIEVAILKDDNSYIPKIDPTYVFNEETTLAILAGFSYKKNVLIQGLHGTGKSTHIEQVAARLNWPCIRVNLDGNLTRTDFIGRDYIIIKDNKQITEFKEGILPWAVKNGIALVLDEYDAARPEFLFILQRLLENEGKLVLIDENQVIEPHPNFRIFATANTLGSGDFIGIYAGTNQLNQAQIDRWHIVVSLDYISPEVEEKIVTSKVPELESLIGLNNVRNMINIANLVRKGFAGGEITTVLTPRTLINWAENILIFGSIKKALIYTYTNKLLPDEKGLVAEFYQRIFVEELFTN